MEISRASDTIDFDTALSQLCSPEWAPSGTHIATRHSDQILKSLLQASRTTDGRATLGEAPGAIESIVGVLRDPLVFHEYLGELAIRILRNLCARSPENQRRVAQCQAHLLVLDCIAKRLEFADGTGADALLVKRMEKAEDEQHQRLRIPFFGFSVEFLVNFVTNNPENAELVWEKAFPTTLGQLLECKNHAAASAAAALVHNCIAVVPHRMKDIVKIWFGESGNPKSLTQSLVQQMGAGSNQQYNEEQFSWSFMIIRRLIAASMFSGCFEVLGPSLSDLEKSKEMEISSDQITLLQILDAAVCKYAESTPDDETPTLEIPDNSLPFFDELIQTALLKQDGRLLQVAGSINASIVIVKEDSKALEHLRMETVKVAINTLRGIAEDKQSTKTKTASTNNIDGLRGIMVRAIAICCDCCKPAQESVRNLGGIPFVLNSLAYEEDDSKNPFLREWGILAVRNLTIDNEENSKDIISYERKGVHKDNTFLEKAGLEAYLDDATGQPKIRMKETTPNSN